MSRLPNQDEFMKREKVDECETCCKCNGKAFYECSICDRKFCELCSRQSGYICPQCPPQLLPLEK